MRRSRWIYWIMAGTILVPAISFALYRIWRARTQADSVSSSASGSANGRQGFVDLRLSADQVASVLSSPGGSNAGSPARLLDVANAAGIGFTYYPDAVPGRFFLPENMGGGAAWFDLDADGWLDLFLTNGCRLPTRTSDRTYVQQFFRQTSPGKFQEVGGVAGAALVQYAQGCIAGDIDNDGFTDLITTAFSNVTLLRNNGDGTLAPDVENALLNDPGWSTSAALGDVNRDGNLDLYVAHYATVSLDDIPFCDYETEHGRVRGYCGPASYTAEPHTLLVNRGDGGFTQLDFSATIEPRGKGLGVIIADLNGDDWPEVYVANDMEANYLFQNHGNEPDAAPNLEEVGLRSGAALSGDGKPEASMGIACADFDGDFDLDLFLTHYFREKNTYYENMGDLSFLDRSGYTGLAAPSLPYLGFGTVPIDYDLDGWQDLFVANGHVLGKLVKPYEMRSQLFRNTGQAQFVEVTSRSGPFFFEERVSRGVALADYDNDGDEDFLAVHLDDRPVSLVRNDTNRAGQSLGLELIGIQSPRSGIGSRVEVRAGDQRWMRTIVGGGSYISASDLRILVGVPHGASSITVEVHWPSGNRETWSHLKPGKYWKLTEGTARRPERSLSQ